MPSTSHTPLALTPPYLTPLLCPARRPARLTLGCSTFVPKAHTPFQWYGVSPGGSSIRGRSGGGAAQRGVAQLKGRARQLKAGRRTRPPCLPPHPTSEGDRRLKRLEKALGREGGIEFRPESYKWSCVQARLGRMHAVAAQCAGAARHATPCAI